MHDCLMPDNELVTLHHRGGVAVVTLNDPRRRNILTRPLVQALAAAMDEAERADTARCIVVTGAGAAFCAGAELSTLRAAADGDFASVESVYLGFLRVRESPLPTIAAVNGPAVGAGFNLALACDIRLAGPAAVFDTRFAELRLHPGGGHTWMLARAVGQQQATLACLFGAVWDAGAAREVGLVAAVESRRPRRGGRAGLPAGAARAGVRTPPDRYAPIVSVYCGLHRVVGPRDRGPALVDDPAGVPGWGGRDRGPDRSPIVHCGQR